jgi:hypothetical protein
VGSTAFPEACARDVHQWYSCMTRVRYTRNRASTLFQVLLKSDIPVPVRISRAVEAEDICILRRAADRSWNVLFGFGTSLHQKNYVIRLYQNLDFFNLEIVLKFREYRQTIILILLILLIFIIFFL